MTRRSTPDRKMKGYTQPERFGTEEHRERLRKIVRDTGFPPDAVESVVDGVLWASFWYKVARATAEQFPRVSDEVKDLHHLESVLKQAMEALDRLAPITRMHVLCSRTAPEPTILNAGTSKLEKELITVLDRVKLETARETDPLGAPKGADAFRKLTGQLATLWYTHFKAPDITRIGSRDEYRGPLLDFAEAVLIAEDFKLGERLAFTSRRWLGECLHTQRKSAKKRAAQRPHVTEQSDGPPPPSIQSILEAARKPE